MARKEKFDLRPIYKTEVLQMQYKENIKIVVR